jgi:hypothetical protein
MDGLRNTLFKAPATLIALGALLVQGVGVVPAIWRFFGAPDKQINVSISYEKVRMPPAAEAALGPAYFHAPHLRYWIYVYLKNNSVVPATNVRVTMRDTTVYSVPEIDTPSSHVTAGDIYAVPVLRAHEVRQVVYYLENPPTWKDLQSIDVVQDNAIPKVEYFGPIVPVPLWHKRWVLISSTMIDTLLLVLVYDWVRRRWWNSRPLQLPAEAAWLVSRPDGERPRT